MEKHKEVWARENTFLEKIINNSKSAIDELHSLIRKRTKQRDSEIDKTRYLDVETASSTREELSVDNRIIFDKKIKLKDHNKFLQEPYFFRVGTDKGAIYISKHFPDLENNIISFTAPAAQLRYAELNHTTKVIDSEFSVLNKDEIQIEDSNLLKVMHEDPTESFAYDGETRKPFTPKTIAKDIKVEKKNLFEEIDDEIKTNAKETKFDSEESTEEKRYVLGEIIEKMRKEQDEIMRAPVDGVTLISGSAGSGKTNIAFHRIVYLIREHGLEKAESLFSNFFNKPLEHSNTIFREENIAVFCFNRSLRKYLESLAEDLGLSKINIFSIDMWIWNILERYSDFNTNERSYSAKVEVVIEKTRREQLYKIDVFVKKEMYDFITEIKDRKRDGTNERLGDFLSPLGSIQNISSLITQKEAIFNEMGEKYKNDKIKVKSDAEEELEKRRKEFISKELLTGLKEFFWTKNSKSKNNFSFRFYDLLSRFYDYVGDTESKRRVEEQKEIYIYDAIIFCHILFALTEGEGINLFPQFDHVVIDEVQDFKPLEIILLEKLSNNSMTIVGDVTQGIFSQGVNSWDEIGVPIDYSYELKLSHRSTLENILFANAVIPESKKTLATTVAKRGSKPEVSLCRDFNDSLDQLVTQITEIKERSPKDSIVVLYPYGYNELNRIVENLNTNDFDSYIASRDSWEFGSRVTVTFYRQIKGLEFDHVFILGLNKFETMEEIKNKQKILYTLITRAQKRTYILCEEQLPNMLKEVDEDLYELV